MGRYRKIDPRIHNDAKYKALSERGKLLFLTILTHPHMTALGAMRATEAGLCEEMALGASGKDAGCRADCAAGCASDSPAVREAGVFESYRQAFRNLTEIGLVKFDPANACLVIPNFLKYNPPESPSVVMAWNKSGDLIPECQLRDELIENTLVFLNEFVEKEPKDDKKEKRKSFIEAFLLRPSNCQTERQTGAKTGGQGGAHQEQEQEQEYKTPLPPKNGGIDVAGSEKPTRRSKRKSDQVSSVYSLDFEKFWLAYPNKRGGKDKAWDIWQRRQRKGNLPPIENLMVCVQKLIHSPKWQEEDGKFIPMVTTFLNAGRWTDAEALQSQDTPQNQPDPNCPDCHGRGLVEAIDDDGDAGMRTCRCRGGKHD
jgi:hypothetical protein